MKINIEGTDRGVYSVIREFDYLTDETSINRRNVLLNALSGIDVIKHVTVNFDEKTSAVVKPSKKFDEVTIVDSGKSREVKRNGKVNQVKMYEVTSQGFWFVAWGEGVIPLSPIKQNRIPRGSTLTADKSSIDLRVDFQQMVFALVDSMTDKTVASSTRGKTKNKISETLRAAVGMLASSGRSADEIAAALTRTDNVITVEDVESMLQTEDLTPETEDLTPETE